MRRAIPLLAALVALCAVASASAESRVRKGTIPLLTAAASRVDVVVSLRQPPLALASPGRGLFSARRKLNVHSSSSRTYVRSLQAAQARAVRDLRTAIPSARVGRRFQLVLDAVTVSLPARDLPTLLRRPWAAHVYPSVAYALATDRSPSIIGADVVRAQTGADGAGIKIAVVDDGIDQSNAFFLPTAFGPVPPGFPKGSSAYTNAKVIVARSFPGAGAGPAGSLPVDPESSFHGTHVAGIAAGIAGTTAPEGGDHPRVTGLSGVAPRAWLGNYRVFTVPTPIGHIANTPEIIAAFEAAVADGMDVVNFSGGGPEIDPSSDALVAAVHSLAAAGVVPVIAAGNDRDDFGSGSVGSPGTAPDAIAVAAVSNTHVFAPALDVTAAGGPKGIPFLGANGELAPFTWGNADQRLVDGGGHLCGPSGALDQPRSSLPRNAFAGSIVLVQRGLCPFTTKSDIAKSRGATGIVVIDNRDGEANQIPVQLSLAGGMIAKADGARLLAFLGAHGGRTTIRVGRDPRELETGRPGVITSFSSGGPTAFGHELKPDVSAPGGQILSSTLPRIDASGFAVFDGTSMATPHVAGAAALLLQLHPSWTPTQVKSALAATAGAAWGDSARTIEAAVPLEGAGLVSLPRAIATPLFTAPTSLSFADLSAGATRTLLVRLTDAGAGAGTWTVEATPQATTAGSNITTSGLAVVPPGGSVDVSVAVTAGTANGENYGFVVLRSGATTLRVPYFFFADVPALAAAPALALKTTQTGDTRPGPSRVSLYRYPVAPFGNQPDRPPMNEDGGEVVYSTTLPPKVVNAGVSILDETDGARIDPWYLGAKDENTVQGFTGTPVDVNELTYDHLEPIGAAGVAFPQPGTYYVSVDSGRGQFDGRRLAGRYVLRSWVDDLKPPSIVPLTTRVTSGRPTIAFRTLDTQSGVDPASLTIGYRGMLVSAAEFDRATGIATFPIPRSAPTFDRDVIVVRMVSSDFQEAKNVDTGGRSLMPNTRTVSVRVHVVSAVTVNWLTPRQGSCSDRRVRLRVTAGSPARLVRVVFSVDGRRAAVDRSPRGGVWASTATLKRGRHAVKATAVDARGRSTSARRLVRVCG